MKMELLVATHNLHKKEEIQQILEGEFTVKSLADYDLHDEIV
ncbi:MAG TPA: non-canonical purine NTP pyrophosphatase, partial [Chryseobacterium sp.]